MQRQANTAGRFDNIQRNYVQPQDVFQPQSSYQYSYPKKEVNFNDLKAIIGKPKLKIQNNRFQGQSSYADSYQYNRNPNTRPELFRHPDNLKPSTEPFKPSTEYTDQLKGYFPDSRAQKYEAPQNQIFPKGHFNGQSSYNNSYLNRQIKRQSQIRPQGELTIGGNRFEGSSSYLNDYARSKEVLRVEKITQKDNGIMPRGDFEGQSTYHQAYIPSQVQKSQKFNPQSQLKVGGKFEGVSSYLQNFDGKQGQKAQKYVQPINQTLPKGRFQSQTSYLNDFSLKQGERTQKYIQPQNQTMPKGKFQGRSNYLDSYQGVGVEKTKQFRPQQEWKVEGDFEGNSSYLNDFKKYENAKRSEITLVPNNKFMPEGQFQSSTSYQNSYQPNYQAREQQYRPVGELKIGGDNFEGTTSYRKEYGPTDSRRQF